MRSNAQPEYICTDTDSTDFMIYIYLYALACPPAISWFTHKNENRTHLTRLWRYLPVYIYILSIQMVLWPDGNVGCAHKGDIEDCGGSEPPNGHLFCTDLHTRPFHCQRYRRAAERKTNGAHGNNVESVHIIPVSPITFSLCLSLALWSTVSVIYLRMVAEFVRDNVTRPDSHLRLLLREIHRPAHSKLVILYHFFPTSILKPLLFDSQERNAKLFFWNVCVWVAAITSDARHHQTPFRWHFNIQQRIAIRICTRLKLNNQKTCSHLVKSDITGDNAFWKLWWPCYLQLICSSLQTQQNGEFGQVEAFHVLFFFFVQNICWPKRFRQTLKKD